MIIVDKKGSPFEVNSFRSWDYPCLVAMYDVFVPKGSFQGMPPVVEEVRHKWIKGLVNVGENFLAWQEGEVIGHVVILPDFQKRDAEYLIFVNQAARGKGVGRALTDAAIGKVKELRLKKVWLTVDAYNFRGIKLYKKAGFEMRQEGSSMTERVMEMNMG